MRIIYVDSDGPSARQINKFNSEVLRLQKELEAKNRALAEATLQAKTAENGKDISKSPLKDKLVNDKSDSPWMNLDFFPLVVMGIFSLWSGFLHLLRLKVLGLSIEKAALSVIY